MLDLFLEFPFNNLLHNKVLNAVLYVLKASIPHLLQHLLSDCRLLSWLLAVPELVESCKGISLRVRSSVAIDRAKLHSTFALGQFAFMIRSRDGI